MRLSRILLPVLVFAFVALPLVARAQDATLEADAAANKALVLRYLVEVWDKGNTDVVNEVLAPDFTWRFSATEVFLVGPGAVKAHADNLNAAIEKMGLTVDIALAEGEYVAARWTLVGIAPPGEGTPQAVGATPQLLCTGNDIYRIEGNLIAELWQETVTCA
jgi:hypothetical protein